MKTLVIGRGPTTLWTQHCLAQSIETVVIPPNVTEISEGAFLEWSNLQEVVLPKDS